MQAHQKIVRDLRAQERGADLFCGWQRDLEIDIKTSVVKEISPTQAAQIILDYEWLGTMPAITLHCFGLFFNKILSGAVVFSPEYAENLGVWDSYGYTGKIICLSRGACAFWAHPHSASKLISQSMKMLPIKYEVVTATVDSEAGEVGTIYQACNFVYVGQMSRGGKRVSCQVSGKRTSGRQAKRLFGTRGSEKLQAMGAAGVQTHPRKGRYFFFLGSKTKKKANRKRIGHLIQPYPKRSLA